MIIYKFIGEITIFTILVLPVVLIIADIVFMVKKKKHPIFEALAFPIGGGYMVLAYLLWSLPPYDMPVNIFEAGLLVHEPVNTEYSAAILLFALLGFAGYIILKFCKKKFPPLIEVFLLGGMYIGMLLCIVFLFQLLMGVHTQPVDVSGLMGDADVEYFNNWKGSLNESGCFIILCLCIVPVLFLIHCIHLMIAMMKEKAQEQSIRNYNNPLLNQLNKFYVKSVGKYLLAVFAMLPLLAVLTVILTLFGQQPDSIILAFTKTSDWILSKEISPPPVAYDAHYLCTVSLRGHRKLVKPLRYGMRRNEKIVVNRQLCVANAFEQMIQERAPGFHRAVRKFYDDYGYPISKHINTAFAADVVYLIMKPLEWVFVIALYMVETNPEDKIASQYLPKNFKKSE
ncbi:MAG: hypothetical protein K2I96_05130 [Lachnospiraceae bacterium]|nr:hypothetical protein [Lachnospiraceae bacterium]